MKVEFNGIYTFISLAELKLWILRRSDDPKFEVSKI